MPIVEFVTIKFKCPNCEKEHEVNVNEKSGIAEWACLSDGIYRPNDCCGCKYILRWKINISYENKIVYKVDIAPEIAFQKTICAVCGKMKHTPIRDDAMGGYVCLTCICKELDRLHDAVNKREVND